MPAAIEDIAKTFAVLTPGLDVRAVPVTPTLYPDLDRDFDGFKGHVLISAHEFSENWPTWERHPSGDEIVMLLDGKATLVLHGADGDESVELAQPGAYVVIPRGTWHTAHVADACRMLFITPGEGTENREEPDT